MKIIRSKEGLEGTCYIEVLPGKYVGQCWNDHAIFFDEEAFGYLEKSIECEHAGYDHYAFCEIHRDTWIRILQRLDHLIVLLDRKPSIDDLESHVYFFYADTKKEFQQDYDRNVQKLKMFILEFQLWIKEQLQRHEYISVLGI